MAKYIPTEDEKGFDKPYCLWCGDKKKKDDTSALCDECSGLK